MTKKAIITIGCSASGKSTFAVEMESQYKWIRIERDRIREFILTTQKQIPCSPFNQQETRDNLWQHWKFKWEDLVDEEFTIQLNRAVKNDFNVVISDTNLNKGRRNALKLRLEELGYEVEFKVFGEDLNLDTLWKRDTYRKNTVGHAVIADQYKRFRQEFPKYKLKDVTNKPEAIIFDVDGTLTLGPHKRSPYEWGKVSQDKPNIILFYSMINYFECGYNIIVMSGRDSVCRQDTKDWIIKHAVEFGASCGFKFDLHMRAVDDQRKDNIVKAELFMNHVDGNYVVAGVYDDRPIMCREWLEFGFNVNCVGNQYCEF
jgi:predicted kinase